MELEQVAENMVDTFVDQATKQIDNSAKNEKLRKLSEDFLKHMKQFEKPVKDIENMAQHMQNLRHSLGDAYNADAEYKELLEEKNKLISDFHWKEYVDTTEAYTEGLNDLLGQTIKTVYVSVSGKKNNKEVHVYDLTGRIDQFFQPAISSGNKLVGRLTATLTQLNASKTEITQFEQRREEEVSVLKDVYIEALNRYVDSGARRVIWWMKFKGKFDGIQVNTRGDISEAFLHSLFSRRPRLAKGLETNIGRFARLILEVDSGSGLLSGDFSSLDKKIQYAAKSFQASTAGVSQAVELAKQVASGKIYNIEQLKRVQKDKAKQAGLRNLLLKDIQNNKDDIIDFIKEKVDKTKKK